MPSKAVTRLWKVLCLSLAAVVAEKALRLEGDGTRDRGPAL